jgi:hypothetical protein
MSPFDQSVVKKNMVVSLGFNQPWVENLILYDYRFTMVFDVLLMAKALKIDMTKYDSCMTNEAFFKAFNADILEAQKNAPAAVSDKLKKKGFVQATEQYISMWTIAPVTVKDEETTYMVDGAEWDKDKDSVLDRLSEYDISWMYKRIAPFMKSVIPAYDIKTSNFKPNCTRTAYVPKNQTEYKVINKSNFRFGINIKEVDKSGNEVLIQNKMATKFVVDRKAVDGDFDMLKKLWGGSDSRSQQNKGKILVRLGYAGAVFSASNKAFEYNVELINYKANNKPKIVIEEAVFDLSDDEEAEDNDNNGTIDQSILNELVDED